MNISEIRPLSTYIGNGGIARRVKRIYMDVNGDLIVEWRRVAGDRSTSSTPLTGKEFLENFAEWAKVLKETWSNDLRHYLHDLGTDSHHAEEMASRLPHLTLV